MRSPVLDVPSLPDRFRVLPHTVPFFIPGFSRWSSPSDRVFVPRDLDCGEWFREFVSRVVSAKGRDYLPICRMSDGEFRFLLGDQPPVPWLPLHVRARRVAAAALRRVMRRGFRAGMRDRYHSGAYDHDEWFRARDRYSQLLASIGQSGIIAAHLSYGVRPFQEHYFPALKQWLASSQLTLNEHNYVPFYFVYAMLTGPTRVELLRGARVLVVNGSDPGKRARIEAGLRREGVADVAWQQLSPDRSLFDILDVSPHAGRFDLALVGAGVGKPNVLAQLAPLQIPCIDAGFVFEVWADPAVAEQRPCCVPDPA